MFVSFLTLLPRELWPRRNVKCLFLLLTYLFDLVDNCFQYQEDSHRCPALYDSFEKHVNGVGHRKRLVDKM